INLSVSEQRVDMLVGANPVEIDLFAGRPEVALNIAPVAGQVFAVAGGKSNHLRAAQLPISAKVGDAHKPDAGDADANHLGPSPWRRSRTFAVALFVEQGGKEDEDDGCHRGWDQPDRSPIVRNGRLRRGKVLDDLSGN